jgi:hypothetical protein
VVITRKDVGQATDLTPAPATEQSQLCHYRTRVRASHSHEPNYNTTSARSCCHRHGWFGLRRHNEHTFSGISAGGMASTKG